MVFAVVLMLPFALGGSDFANGAFRDALAFLAMLQVTAALLNFLPVPGLDGYGVIEPWLSHGVRRQVEPFAPFGLIAVFGCLWIPQVSTHFWDVIYAIMRPVRRAPTATPTYGYQLFRFWRQRVQRADVRPLALRTVVPRHVAGDPAIRIQTMPRKLPWAKDTTAAASASTQTTRAKTASRRAGPGGGRGDMAAALLGHGDGCGHCPPRPAPAHTSVTRSPACAL